MIVTTVAEKVAQKYNVVTRSWVQRRHLHIATIPQDCQGPLAINITG